ncbi:cell division ATP-binding protein FtsE [Anaeromyxobacter paludicola]|uniref:Cell division ATP-binding protein FtsE n=1 Tax=Anaeromyxobacter paludicola TaxID=2918171 RepID=A0ABN6N752_9BACT|nr:cell division ATP-binding protein FtsE [Anaeromyxobacter paludicola]BDG09004.1 cell division ATP-binding protein FtsE [Anaeromyxobacter paludicola]
MIQLFHVYKQYAGEAPALADVSLDIDKGEFVFLTGPSGAGKSTLLKLVLCAEQITSGQLLIFGRNVARIRDTSVPVIRRNMGFVFQDFKLLPQRTVLENVGFPLEVRAFSPREVRRRSLAVLEQVGLAGKADKFPLSLSGGEQQRVAVARALVADPPMLLADEPTGNLDPDMTLEVMDLLSGANRRGTTVLVATHDRSLLERYRHRVVALEAGRVAFDGELAPKAAAR